MISQRALEVVVQSKQVRALEAPPKYKRSACHIITASRVAMHCSMQTTCCSAGTPQAFRHAGAPSPNAIAWQSPTPMPCHTACHPWIPVWYLEPYPLYMKGCSPSSPCSRISLVCDAGEVAPPLPGVFCAPLMSICPLQHPLHISHSPILHLSPRTARI